MDRRRRGKGESNLRCVKGLVGCVNRMTGALIFTLAPGACGFALMDSASSELCQKQRDEVEIGRVRVPGPCLDRRTPAAPRARESWFGRAGGPPIAVGESCVIGWRRAVGGPRRGELLSDWLGGTKKRSNSNYWSRLSRGLAPSSTQPLRLVRQISKPEL